MTQNPDDDETVIGGGNLIEQIQAVRSTEPVVVHDLRTPLDHEVEPVVIEPRPEQVASEAWRMPMPASVSERLDENWSGPQVRRGLQPIEWLAAVALTVGLAAIGVLIFFALRDASSDIVPAVEAAASAAGW